MSTKQEISDCSLNVGGDVNFDLNQIYCNPLFEGDGLGVPTSSELKKEMSNMHIKLHEDFSDSTQDNRMERESLEDDCKQFLRIDIKEECSKHSNPSLEGGVAVPVSFELKDKLSDMLTELHDIGDTTQDSNQMEREKLGDNCKPFLHVDIKEEYLVDDYSVQEQDPLAISPNLILHSSLHMSDTPFKCITCNIAFKEKCQFSTHCKMHSGGWPFKCATCGKAFITKAYLTSHRRKHTGERPYKCATCSKAFRQKSTLTRHCIIHMGNRPFKCTFCSKTFVQRAHLEIHSRSHTGDKPFKCATCSKAFREKGTLTRHCRIHMEDKPFKCASCGKTFGQKAHLELHSRTHTGSKPFKCATCSKMFTDKSNLNTHFRIHTGEKPYKCAMCSKRFVSKAHLIKHHRNHTGDTLAAGRVVKKQV